MQGKPNLWLPLVGGLGLNAALVGWSEQQDVWMILEASGGLWVTIAMYVWWRKSASLSVLFPAYCVVFWLNYLLPVFTSEFLIRSSPVGFSYVQDAALLSFSGLLCFCLGVAVVPVHLLASSRILQVDIDLKLNSRNLFLLAGALLPLKLVMFFAPPPPLVAQPLNAASQIGLMAASGLFLLYLRKQLLRGESVVLILLLVLFIGSLFLTGFLALPVGALSVLLVTYSSVRKRPPWGLILLFIPAFLMFSRIKSEFRRDTWQYENDTLQTSFVESLAALPRLLSESLDPNYESKEDLLKRVDHLTAFGFVVESTPSRVPYWEGQTYTALFSSVVPRLIWPDKPISTVGQDYGHRYGYLDPSDHSTSVNLEQTVEMFVNFGEWAVYLGMFLLGAMYRAVFTIFLPEKSNDVTLLMAAATIPGLLVIESNFALVHGALFQMLLFWAVSFYFLSRIGLLRRSAADTKARGVAQAAAA